jgi:hypothetical protein
MLPDLPPPVPEFPAAMALSTELKRKIVEKGCVREGVAHYHSRHPDKQARYLLRVPDNLSRIVARLAALVR